MSKTAAPEHKPEPKFETEPSPQAEGLSYEEAAVVAGIGRSTLYVETREGRLIARKIGNRSVILRADLLDWLRSRPLAYERSRAA